MFIAGSDDGRLAISAIRKHGRDIVGVHPLRRPLLRASPVYSCESSGFPCFRFSSNAVSAGLPWMNFCVWTHLALRLTVDI
jgi:hypothetical protein